MPDIFLRILILVVFRPAFRIQFHVSNSTESWNKTSEDTEFEEEDIGHRDRSTVRHTMHITAQHILLDAPLDRALIKS